jgi:hypothetical protein
VDLAFPINAGQIIRLPHSPAAFIVVSGDDFGRIDGEIRNSLEDILGRVGREIRDELVIDGQVRSEHEEMPDAFGFKEISDERAHKTRFAHARR